MSESNVAVVLEDQFSDGVAKMESANQGFNKSLEETDRKAQDYARRLSSLRTDQAKLQTSVEAARRELNLAKKAFQETGEAADSETLNLAYQKYNKIQDELKQVTRAAQDTRRELSSLGTDTASSTTTGTDGSMGGVSSASMVSQLATAGAFSLVGDVAADALGQFATSALGEVGGNYVSSSLSSAGMGGGIGLAIAGPVGAAVGAALGGIAGLVTAKMDELGDRDDAYRDMVQSTFDEVTSLQAQTLDTGVGLAAGREMDAISFGTLFGDQAVGDRYLADVVELSNFTPFLYEDLKGLSKTLLTYGFGEKRLIPTLTNIGDAGSAMGMSTDDMSTVATAIGRLENTGKTTLEYVNLLSERGLDVIGWLGERDGLEKADVYANISDGAYDGGATAQLVLDKMESLYGGSMAVQSGTYQGMTSTIQGLEDELALAQGDAFIEARKPAMEEKIDALSGDMGDSMKKAYSLMGEFEADLVNQKEALERNALNSVMSGVLDGDWDADYQKQLEELMGDYDTASLEGDGAKMGQALAGAKALAIAAYEESEGRQMQIDSENALISSVQAAVSQSYYDAGYDRGVLMSKGIQAAMTANAYVDSPTVSGETDSFGMYSPTEWAEMKANGFAYGLNRVPYDNFPAVLHQGERVLTAEQARASDGGGGSAVTISGNTFVVREEADVTKVAEALVRKISAAKLVCV